MTEIEKLLDEANDEVIVLFNENNEEVAFEQIAVIPIEGQIYAILKPVKPMVGVGEDEGLVFKIVEIDDEDCLVLVDNEEEVNAVFDVYDKLLEDAGLV